MKKLNLDDVIAGRGAWEPWRYLSPVSVTEYPLYPGNVKNILAIAPEGTHKLVRLNAIAVIETTKAINRMMGRHELTGIPMEDLRND